MSTRLGQQGVLKAGVMAGAGEARTNATSQLIHPGTGMAIRADAPRQGHRIFADLVSTRLGQQGVLKAGVMAGAGEARTNATSQL
ncbi:hypothetical protein CTI14_65810, partial [Methylobacterium radiotolerans]